MRISRGSSGGGSSGSSASWRSGLSTAAVLFAVAVLAYAALLSLPLAGEAATPGGSYSGTISVSESVLGNTGSGSGQWSFTVDGSGSLTGSSDFQMTVAFPSVAGCSYSPSSFTISTQLTWTGYVQGSTAYITESGTVSSTTPSLTVTCSGGGSQNSQTIPLDFSTTVPQQQFTMDLSQLENGGSYSNTVEGMTLQYSLSSSVPVTTQASQTTQQSQQSTTVPPTTTQPPTTQASSASTPTSCHVVNPTEHIDVCVPDWLSGSSSGTATVTSPGGSPTPFNGQLPYGDTLQTGPSSYATVSDGETTVTAGPNSQLTESGCLVGSSGAPYCFPESANYEISKVVSDALDKALKGDILGALWTYGHGIYHVGTDILNKVQEVAPILMSTDAVFIHESGSSANLVVAANGTTIQVMAGTWEAVSQSTGDMVNLTAGQQLFIPSNPTLASTQNFAGSVQAFNPGSVNQWWSNPNPPPNPLDALFGFVFIAVVVFLVAGVALKIHRRSRRRPKATPAQAAPPAAGFCPACGTPAPPGAAFCGRCGAKL